MCCLPVEQTLGALGDSVCAHGCAPMPFAHRLRWIGDQLEKRWAANDKSSDDGQRSGGKNIIKSFQIVCTVIQVTLLVFLVKKRHLQVRRGPAGLQQQVRMTSSTDECRTLLTCVQRLSWKYFVYMLHIGVKFINVLIAIIMYTLQAIKLPIKRMYYYRLFFF